MGNAVKNMSEFYSSILYARIRLDNSILPYVHSFMNHSVNGQQLLSLQPEDLEHLSVLKLGHQEIILEAVEYLRNFHYELDRENLQLLALRLSCQAHSLHNELSRQTDSKPVTTQTLSDVASVVMAVKPLVRWLDRPPFCGQLEYNDKKTELMKLSLEMATCAQRDRFAEKPIEEIRTTCDQLAKLADYIIQDTDDPMILQPASLDLATLKKKSGDDLGFYILPSFHGVHQIAEIKFGSAAHQCGKMEEGDEIVQVNYQTVVGWERKNLLELFRESPAEILLTLKRRPRHTKVYGQIYIKPYRLPSNKKTSYTTRWQHNLPSPRPELLTIPDFTMPLPRHMPKNPSPEPASILDTVNMLDTMATDSSDSDSEVEPPLSIRLYSAKPRNLVQRRATITGASPTSKHGIDIEQFWKELKQEHSTTFQLRDKAASCAHGLDNVLPVVNIRPQTCLGLESTKKRKKTDEQTDDKKVQFEEKLTDVESIHPDDAKRTTHNVRERVTPTQSCDDGTNATNKNSNNKKQVMDNVNDSNNISDIIVPLDECNNFIGDTCNINKNTLDNTETGARYVKERGKLDKSYSTPAYDLSDTEDREEDRKLAFLQNPFCKLDLPVHCSNNVPSGASTKTDVCTYTDSAIDEKLKNTNGEHKETSMSRICGGNVARKISDIEKQIAHENAEEQASVFGVPKELDSLDCALTQHAKLLEKKSSVMISNEDSTNTRISPSNNVKSSIEDDLPNVSKMQISGKPQIKEIKSAESPLAQAMIQSCRYIELPKIESVRKLENKSHVTPPEPPPRKYYTKHAAVATNDLKLNITSKIPNSLEKPQVPERPKIRRDFRKVDNLNLSVNHTRSNSDCQDRENSSSDVNTENSIDFIERQITSLNDQKFTQSDTSLYNENANKQLREDKYSFEKYEPFIEKFACSSQSITDCYKSGHSPRNVECLDGATHSKQMILDLKAKSSEKDKSFEKSVVNRAMMVARSIGLHSSLSKSNSSPRSNRKRNMLLAKRRNVSVKDVGSGDLEGWLIYRSRGAGGAWARAWFVLKCSSLYRFKTQDSAKADCLIVLTGFTVSPAAEVKSRKYAFKVYHTGTVFYFAADAEDSLILWLDAVSKGTLGADTNNQTIGLFSETDESDSENHKSKIKCTLESKPNLEKNSFGSLKKVVRKDIASFKDHEISGASLDRKYLKFLGARNQNMPVPTAQFRSYRRVLPTSTPKKEDSNSNSPDLQMTIAGSTFYGLSGSQSAMDMSSSSNNQDMGDYRRTTDRSIDSRNRRPDDLQSFITLEEFMLSQQNEDQQRSSTINRSLSPRATPLTGDHVHVEHRNLNNNAAYGEQIRQLNDTFLNNDTGYIYGKTNDEISRSSNAMYAHSRNTHEHTVRQVTGDCLVIARSETKGDCVSDKSYGKYTVGQKKIWDPSGSVQKRRPQEFANAQQTRHTGDSNHWRNPMSSPIANKHDSPGYSRDYEHNTHVQSSNHESYQTHDCVPSRNVGTSVIEDFKTVPKRHVRNDDYSGSSSDLASHTFEAQQRINNVTINRKGSFNLTNRHDYNSSDKHWLDSLRRGGDKKGSNYDQNRLKNVAQYQPPPITTSPFEQEGSPRLHRALFRDKCSNQSQHRLSTRSGSQSPGDSGISQSHSSFSGNSPSQTLSQSFSSVSSVSDWSPDVTTSSNISKYGSGYLSGHRGFSNSGRSSLAPPTLPYIPPPTSPPPDYPGLEYPPVFEPGTYSLSDASLLRNRNKNSQDTT
ncbi:Connector enhancer of kinase suppressor of ras 3 [Camponotus floridanus]|uniref:Connector enhancer of kinase suppressor of ras 3 n=1 Tax=Camponotus floridanus TaxID=104421 RepID=E2A1K6_CAMFO|nr:Connector enhancer of kinase suppressor of ras 3 [Camponotus floridanus]